MLEQCKIGGSKGKREIGNQARGDAESTAKFDYLIYPHLCQQADGRYVARFRQRVQQRDGPFVLVIIIMRRPNARGRRETYGTIHNRIERAHAVE